MIFFDPLYLAFLAPALLLSLVATILVKSRFARYAKVPPSSGLTGAAAARRILDQHGLHDVGVEAVQGFLGDHYDPRARVLRLSPDVYGGRSLAAVGVAAHEAGHALQHADRYAPLALRSALVPVASLGSSLSWILIMVGMFLGSLGLAKIGLFLFAGMVAFTLVTLPVEFNATSRAKALVTRYGIVTETERRDLSKVLNAAALTYVAAALTAVLQLLYFALRLGVLGGSDD